MAVEGKTGNVRNRNRRRRSTLTIIREWISGIWVSVTTSLSSGRRRRENSQDSNDSFRVSGRKSKSRSGKLSITRPVIEKEMVGIPSKRNYRSHLLVLGLSGAGKSRVIEQLVRQELQKVPPGTSFITEIDTDTLTIIEGPGMCTGSGFETDATTVGTIKQYLDNKIPNQIPNAVIIVARFDDSRFEGDGSDFTRMLNGLKCLRKYLTDSDLTNIVLVLTFTEGVENVDFKLSRFRKTVESVFPETNGVRTVTLDKDGRNMSRLIAELSAVANERDDAHFKEALSMFKRTDFIRSYPVGLTPASEFLPPQNVIYKIMEKLNGNKLSSGASEDSETEDDKDSNIFPVMMPYNKMHNSDYLVAQTWLRKGTLVKMADGSELPVDTLRVGDKLLNFRLKSDVVDSVETKTMRKWKEDNKSGVEPFMALIHCSLFAAGDNDGRVLQFNRGRIRMMPYVEPIDPVSDEEVLYCIRMNSSDGTYVADNCVFKHRNPPYPDVTRL